MGRPRTKPIVDESTLAKICCVKCNNFHPFTHFTKTKQKDEAGNSVRRTTCKHCIFSHWIVPKESTKLRMHLNAIRHRCKTNNLPFNITLEDLEIPKECPILGIPLLSHWGESKGSSSFNSPSVDKIIPELGYVKGNVQIISNRANIMKNDATLDNVRALLIYMEKNIPKGTQTV